MPNFYPQVVVDAEGVPLANAVGQVFAIDDYSNTTPLALFDASGSPVPLDELIANGDGVTPEFSTSTYIVKWVSSGGHTVGMVAYDLIPSGGTAGQSLVKGSNNDYDMTWENPLGLPIGGADGQVLLKDGVEPFVTRWGDTSGSGGSDRGVMGFGAVGDGITDDTAAIQLALNQGGAVYFPPGAYLITAPLRIEYDGMFLYGRGTGNRSGATQAALGSRIIAGSGFVGTEMIKVQRAANDRPLQGVVIEDLTLDGQLNGSTATDGVLFRVSQGGMHNVHIWKMKGVGLRVKGYGAPAPWDTYDTRFTSLLIGDCDGAGTHLDEGATDLHYSHCIFFRNQDNMLLTGGGSAQVTGCHFYDADRNDIRFAGSGSRSKFANCKIEGATEHLVLIDSTVAGYADIQFTGCGFSNIKQTSATNTWDFIHIMGPTGNGISRNTFIANNFNLKGGATVKARYAINIASTASQATMVLSNVFGPASNWGTAPLNNASNSSNLPYIKGNANLSDVVLANVQTASYTLTADDADTARVVEMNSATGVTVTVPPNAQPGFFKGNVVKVVQTGAGQVTFAPGAGVTLRTPRSLTTRAQWSSVSLRQTGTNQWILEGDLT